MGDPEADVADDRPLGLLASLRRMFATLLALVHTRVELFTTEIEEEIQRAAGILLWALVALFFGSLTVLFAAVLILIVFWEEHRILAASLITAAFFLLTLTFGMLARSRLRAKPRFMAASIEELKRDRATLERNQ
jgi:uncharacterized membrane protein YqjE